ncbi:helix-turn-helix domain-containing protein [Chryseobacterium gleum]|uniref:helix-turn-helix domain-containing protein n=1 Tax=Chryseobacterium gleum TaxID=250 RepID=UPI00241DDCA3|nr:helix-turn-helix transcriptional regulator [Chryseobacterium gleum]
MNRFGIEVYSGKVYKKKIIFDRPFFLPHSCILILKSGEISFERQLQFSNINTPILTFIDREMVYEFSHISDDIEAYIIAVSLPFFDAVSKKINTLNLYNFFKANRGFHYDLSPFQVDEFFNYSIALQTIINNADNHKNVENLLKVMFEGLLYLFSDLIDDLDHIQDKMSRQELITLTFLRNVEKLFKEEKNVRYFANLQSITVRYLSATLKSTINKTAQEIINEFQIKEAMALLVDTDHTLAKIAEILGFCDRFTFSHFFKRNTDISPSKYRTYFKNKHSLH